MTMLAPVETRYARSAMVSSADHVATGAGVAMLRAGGSAADAAIAANAVPRATWPPPRGPGGDPSPSAPAPLGAGRRPVRARPRPRRAGAGRAQRVRPRRLGRRP